MTTVVPFESDLEKLQEGVDIFEERVRSLQERRFLNNLMKLQLRQRLRMCAVNTVVDLARKVFNGAGMSTHKLEQLAADADDEQLASIPPKYWKCIRSLSKIINENGVAYESEVEFAGLLVLEEACKGAYEFFKYAFPIVYGGSVEEVAERPFYFWDIGESGVVWKVQSHAALF